MRLRPLHALGCSAANSCLDRAHERRGAALRRRCAARRLPRPAAIRPVARADSSTRRAGQLAQFARCALPDVPARPTLARSLFRRFAQGLLRAVAACSRSSATASRCAAMRAFKFSEPGARACSISTASASRANSICADLLAVERDAVFGAIQIERRLSQQVLRLAQFARPARRCARSAALARIPFRAPIALRAPSAASISRSRVLQPRRFDVQMLRLAGQHDAQQPAHLFAQFGVAPRF